MEKCKECVKISENVNLVNIYSKTNAYDYVYTIKIAFN